MKRAAVAAILAASAAYCAASTEVDHASEWGAYAVLAGNAWRNGDVVTSFLWKRPGAVMEKVVVSEGRLMERETIFHAGTPGRLLGILSRAGGNAIARTRVDASGKTSREVAGAFQGTFAVPDSKTVAFTACSLAKPDQCVTQTMQRLAPDMRDAHFATVARLEAALPSEDPRWGAYRSMANRAWIGRTQHQDVMVVMSRTLEGTVVERWHWHSYAPGAGAYIRFTTTLGEDGRFRMVEEGSNGVTNEWNAEVGSRDVENTKVFQPTRRLELAPDGETLVVTWKKGGMERAALRPLAVPRFFELEEQWLALWRRHHDIRLAREREEAEANQRQREALMQGLNRTLDVMNESAQAQLRAQQVPQQVPVQPAPVQLVQPEPRPETKGVVQPQPTRPARPMQGGPRETKAPPAPIAQAAARPEKEQPRESSDSYLKRLLQGTRLKAVTCIGGDGKYFVTGTRPRLQPETVPCVDVHYRARCRDDARTYDGVAGNFVGHAGCFGDTYEIQPKPACDIAEVTVEAVEARPCGK